MTKEIKHGNDSLAKIVSGVNQLADTVKATLGPAGQVVILEKMEGPPLITKDGVSVAREVYLEDPFENIGAQVVKEVASKTNDIAGDGTTTATVLAQALLNEGAKLVVAGYNPTRLRDGLYHGLEAVKAALAKLSKDVKNSQEIAQVGTISANGDTEIGGLLADAIDKVGQDGVITIAESGSLDTFLTVTEGMELDRGYINQAFITDAQRNRAVYQHCRIMITDQKLEVLEDVVALFDPIAKKKIPLLIIAEDIGPNMMKALVINKVREVMKVVAIRTPGYGVDKKREILKDIATMVGATVISPDNGLKVSEAREEHLGRADEAIVEKDRTIIVGGDGDLEKVNERIEKIRYDLETTQSEYDKEKLQERLAKLTGGVAVVNIGAATEVEMREKKARVEDALHATRAAVQEGIVPGGGVALARCVKALDAIPATNDPGFDAGVNMLKAVCKAPLKQIAANAGESGDVVVSEVLKQKKESFGYNAATKTYEDMLKAGVIDPAKVVRTALENAVSVSSLLFSHRAVVVNKREPGLDPLLAAQAQALGIPPR